MVRIDENQEAVAQIRTAVNAVDTIFLSSIEEEESSKIDKVKPVAPQTHWRLGSPQKRTTKMEYQDEPAFRGFHKHLIIWLKQTFKEAQITGLPMIVCN